MRTLGHVFGALLLLTGLVGCTTFHIDESNMIPSFGRGQLETMLPSGYQVTEHEFERADGERVYGVSVTGGADRPNLLIYGGNMQTADGSISRAVDNLGALEVNIHFFDRRGQGRSTGTPSVDQVKADTLEIFDYVRDAVDGPIILHGLSLGGFEAVSVAGKREVDALILEATATNVDDFARTAIPWYAKPFIRVEVADELRGIDNTDNLAHYDGPLLLLAGEKDRQTSPRMMEALYEASPSEHKQLVMVEGANHNNVMRHTQAREAYREFLQAAGLLP